MGRKEGIKARNWIRERKGAVAKAGGGRWRWEDYWVSLTVIYDGTPGRGYRRMRQCINSGRLSPEAVQISRPAYAV